MPKKTSTRVHSSSLLYNQQAEKPATNPKSKKRRYIEVDNGEISSHAKVGRWDDVALLKPFCDRITLVGWLDASCLAAEALEGASASDVVRDIWEMMKDRVWRSKSISGVQIYAFSRVEVRDYRCGVTSLGTKGSILLVGVSNKPENDKFKIRLQFNPAELGKAGLSDVEQILLDLCDDQIDFARWLSAAGMPDLDISCDLLNVEVCDLVLRFNAGHKWRGYHDDQGRLQTWERIRRPAKSKGGGEYRSILILYDKRAQLREAGKAAKWEGIPYARLERPLTQTKRKFISLATQKNPFADVGLGYVPIEMRRRGRTWRQYFAATRWQGLEAASKAVPSARRGQWRAAVLNGNAAFWIPSKIWAGWPATLKRDGLAGWIVRAQKASKAIQKK